MNQFTTSLWGDEAWAATLAVKSYLQIIQIVARDTSPPLFYLLLHTWMKFFGTSEVAIRSLTFIFFLGTVLTVFLIGSYLWERKTGLVAALLTLTNPFLFSYAFEGRMYSLLALTSTLSIYFFLKKHRLGFILATTAALYTHHFSLLIVAFEGIWLLKEGWKSLKKNLTSFLLIALFYLPWLYPLYYQSSLVASGFWLGKPTFQTLMGLIYKFLAGPDSGILEKMALGAIVITLVLRRWWTDKEKSFFLLGWFFIPLLLTFFISQFFQSIFFDRYMLMVIPAVCVLIASLRRKLSFLPLIIIIFSLSLIDYHYFLNPTKRPFRQLADYVKKEVPSLPRINYNAASHHLFETKYYGIPAPIYAPIPLPFYTGTALMEKEDIIQILPKVSEILAISSENPKNVSLPGWELEKTKKFDSLYLLWLKRVQ